MVQNRVLSKLPVFMKINCCQREQNYRWYIYIITPSVTHQIAIAANRLTASLYLQTCCTKLTTLFGLKKNWAICINSFCTAIAHRFRQSLSRLRPCGAYSEQIAYRPVRVATLRKFLENAICPHFFIASRLIFDIT